MITMIKLKEWNIKCSFEGIKQQYQTPYEEKLPENNFVSTKLYLCLQLNDIGFRIIEGKSSQNVKRKS